jgi:hypothetical protein
MYAYGDREPAQRRQRERPPEGHRAGRGRRTLPIRRPGQRRPHFTLGHRAQTTRPAARVAPDDAPPSPQLDPFPRTGTTPCGSRSTRPPSCVTTRSTITDCRSRCGHALRGDGHAGRTVTESWRVRIGELEALLERGLDLPCDDVKGAGPGIRPGVSRFATFAMSLTWAGRVRLPERSERQFLGAAGALASSRGPSGDVERGRDHGPGVALLLGGPYRVT